MKLMFELAVMVCSFMLIKVHLIISFLIYLVFAKVLNVEMAGNIGFCAYLAISAIGHVRGTMNSIKEMNDPNAYDKSLEDIQDFNEAIKPKNSIVFQGIALRCRNEWKYMKKTFNFDFKSEVK